jgi:hypothetical protein
MVVCTIHLASGEEQSIETEVDAENISIFIDRGEQKAVGQC